MPVQWHDIVHRLPSQWAQQRASVLGLSTTPVAVTLKVLGVVLSASTFLLPMHAFATLSPRFCRPLFGTFHPYAPFSPHRLARARPTVPPRLPTRRPPHLLLRRGLRHSVLSLPRAQRRWKTSGRCVRANVGTSFRMNITQVHSFVVACKNHAVLCCQGLQGCGIREQGVSLVLCFDSSIVWQ